jgi:hypothetical protein
VLLPTKDDLGFLLLPPRNYALSAKIFWEDRMLEQVVIANAIKEYTDHARRHAHRKAFLRNERPSGADVEAQRVAVHALCDRIEDLGRQPDSVYSNFQALHHEMGPDYPPPLPDFNGIVEHAFEKAGRLSAANAKAA